jgi:hypothetical protein
MFLKTAFPNRVSLHIIVSSVYRPSSSTRFSPANKSGIAGTSNATTLPWDLDTGKLIRRYNLAQIFTPIFLPNNHMTIGNNELWRIDTTLDELMA